MKNKKDIEKTVSYKWFHEVWNQGNESSIDKFMTEDSNAHGIIQEGQPNGAAGFKNFYHDFRKKFKDINIEVEDVICQDNLECARTKVIAEHIETKIKVSFTGMSWARIEDGKIAEAWNNYDFLEMYKQLGLINL